MIIKILEIRTFLIKLYQKGRFIINPLIRFLVAFLVFKGINNNIGYDTRFTGTTITLLLSVICAVLPSGMTVFLAMALSLVHVLKASIFVAPLLLILYIILYAMLMRFSPKQAIVSVLIPLLAGKNLHYCVPLILGCTATPLSALPCACGLIIYYMLDIVKAAVARQVQLNLDDMLQLYLDIVNATLANKQMFIAVVVFALVVIVVYLIRQFSFEYALVISIGAGVITNILGFLVADFKYSSTVKIGTLILMSVVCGLIAYVAEFFKRVLDYTAIERVQFEDDDYYYYVKAVPKINLSMPRHNVQRMGDVDTDGEDDEDDYRDISIVGNDDVRYEEYTEEDYNIDTDTSNDENDDSDRFPGISSQKDETDKYSRRRGRYAFDEDKYIGRASKKASSDDDSDGDGGPDETPESTGIDEIPADGEASDAEVKYVDFDEDDFK